jgi:hypothetical protein
VVVGNVTDISELHPSSIFRVEDGGSMYLQNAGNIAHNHTVQQPKNKININKLILLFLYFVHFQINEIKLKSIWRFSEAKT